MLFLSFAPPITTAYRLNRFLALMLTCISARTVLWNLFENLRAGLYEMAMFAHNLAQSGKLSDPVELSVAEYTV